MFSASSPLLFLLLLLPHLLLLPPPAVSSSSPRARLVFGTERYARSVPTPHRRLLLRPAPYLLHQPLPAPRVAYPLPGYSRREDPLESYRAFVEQEEFPEGVEEEEPEDEGEVEAGPYSPEYRHAVRGPLPPMYSLNDAPQYRFATPYTAYYERPPEMAYGRPSAAAMEPRRVAADPVEDLEEEMRQEEEAGTWASPWWGGGEVEDEGYEAAREAEEEEEAAERAATDGAFLRNLILAQRYREDSLRPEPGQEGGKRRGGRRGDSGDRAVRELESLAGKRSAPSRIAPERPPATAAPEETPAPTTPSHSNERGQKEVAMPRPASPPRRPLDASLLVGRRWPEGDRKNGNGSSGRSVYAALEKLLDAKDTPSAAVQRHHQTNQRTLQKRFVSGEDAMMQQLNELKRA